jgi:NAD(P)-dependent dehydrogenase (short-subunit alcohol dehydrogenase family)
MDTKGKVAIITGGSRGIGKQMATRLARHGVNVVLAARTVEQSQSEWPGSLTETTQELKALGVEATPVKCDLTVRKDVENLCQTALDKYGRVDFLLNNARYVGEGHFDPFLDIPLDLWEKYLNANVLAPIVATKLCLPSMIKNKGGVIINTTSAAAYSDSGLPGGRGGTGPHYPMTKAALDRFIRAVSLETEELGIPILGLDPGATMTERVSIQTAKFGFDMSMFHPMDIPAAAAEYICCTCPNPMRYNGQTVVATILCKQFNLK